MVLAPHQDDEVLGCGGLLHRLARRGTECTVACLGLKVKNHRVCEEIALGYFDQQAQACTLLGVKTLLQGPFPTERFAEHQQDLVIWIAEVVREIRPDWMLFPWHGDLHQDHRAVSEAARFSLRGFDPHCPTRGLMYEVPGASGYDLTQPFAPSVYAHLCAEDACAKIRAFECYVEEQRGGRHPRSVFSLCARMQQHGQACGRRYAEAFVPYREMLYV